MRNTRSTDILRRVLIFILVLTISLTSLPLTSAYAENTNSSGGNSSSSPSPNGGGYSWDKTGYLCYIIRVRGTQDSDFDDPDSVSVVTEPKFVTVADSRGLASGYNTSGLYAKFNKSKKATSVALEDTTGMPTPYTAVGNKGISNQKKLVEWTKEEVPKGWDNDPTKLELMIYNLWDAPLYIKYLSNNDAYDEYKNYNPRNCFSSSAPEDTRNSTIWKFLYSQDNYYFIFEAVYWMEKNNTLYAATSTGWADIAKSKNWPAYGSITNVFPRHLTFKKRQFGLNPVKGSMTLDKLTKKYTDHSSGYANGLISIWNKEDINTTCDESKEGPHTAPDESEGIYTITKLYRVKKIINKSDGTQEIKYRYTKKTQRQNVAQKIRIEDETCTDPDRGDNDGHEYYKVIAYQATDKTRPTSNISDWDHIPGTKSGSIKADKGVYSRDHNVENLPTPTTYHEVVLNSTYKHLYILLEKAEPEDTVVNPTGTYTLNESDITQKIKLSDTEKLLNADGTNKLLTHAFIWESPKFTLTACRGDSGRTDHRHFINHGNQTGAINLIPDCDNYTVGNGSANNAEFIVSCNGHQCTTDTTSVTKDTKELAQASAIMTFRGAHDGCTNIKVKSSSKNASTGKWTVTVHCGKHYHDQVVTTGTIPSTTENGTCNNFTKSHTRNNDGTYTWKITCNTHRGTCSNVVWGDKVAFFALKNTELANSTKILVNAVGWDAVVRQNSLIPTILPHIRNNTAADTANITLRNC